MNREVYDKIEYALGLIAEKKDAGIDLLYRYMGKNMLFVARGIVKDAFARRGCRSGQFYQNRQTYF